MLEFGLWTMLCYVVQTKFYVVDLQIGCWNRMVRIGSFGQSCVMRVSLCMVVIPGCIKWVL
jgi:hypothetical protein